MTFSGGQFINAGYLTDTFLHGKVLQINQIVVLLFHTFAEGAGNFLVAFTF